VGAVVISAARLAKLRRNWALGAGVAEVLKRGPLSLLIAVVVVSVAVVVVLAALGGKSVEAGTRQAAVKMKAS
jgi:hypothetical protein